MPPSTDARRVQPVPGASEGLRERKKAATRLGLRHAAVRLGRQHGPDAVTVDAICAEVDVSPRTFFNHFETKDDAFFGTDPDHLAAVTAAVADRPADEDVLAAVTAVLADVLADAAGSSVWHEQLLLLREHPQLVPRLQAALRETETAVAEGVARRTRRFRAELYVQTVAAVAMTAVRVALTRWLDSPSGADPRDPLAEVVTLLRSGLAAPID